MPCGSSKCLHEIVCSTKKVSEAFFKTFENNWGLKFLLLLFPLPGNCIPTSPGLTGTLPSFVVGFVQGSQEGENI